MRSRLFTISILLWLACFTYGHSQDVRKKGTGGTNPTPNNNTPVVNANANTGSNENKTPNIAEVNVKGSVSVMGSDEPVTNAQIVITGKGVNGNVYTCSTDDKGEFSITTQLDQNRNYQIQITKKGLKQVSMPFSSQNKVVDVVMMKE